MKRLYYAKTDAFKQAKHYHLVESERERANTNDRFLSSIFLDDELTVEKIINNGVNVNEYIDESHNATSLHVAARFGSYLAACFFSTNCFLGIN